MNEAISGLGTLGFWLFMAVLAVAVAWVVVRRAQIRQETLAKIIDSGQNLDSELIEKIFSSKYKPEQKEKSYNPYKAGNEGAGFFFFIGFIVVFFGIVRKPISYPMIGLGVFAMLWAHWVWHSIGKEVKKQLEKKNPEELE